MLGAGNRLPLAGKAKGTVGSTVFRAQHAAAPGPFPPPLRPSSNSTPGKLGFESSLRGRCEREARAGRGRAGTPEAERPKGPPPTSASPPTRAVRSPFLPPPVVREARAAAPSRPGSLTTSHRPREWWRQWQPPALTLRALSPFSPGSPAPGRTLGSSCAPLSPSGCHSYTLQTLLSLWLPFIISGLGWPRTLGRQPRGWGRCDLGLVLLSLAGGSCLGQEDRAGQARCTIPSPGPPRFGKTGRELTLAA